jgi:hypothetical protein
MTSDIISWLGSKFPQTTFHNARDILSLFHEDSTVEKWKLYNVTSEMKTAILEWFLRKAGSGNRTQGPRWIKKGSAQ